MAIREVSTTADGTQATGGQSAFPEFSLADGNQIVFSSSATNLVAGDTNGQRDIFIKNLSTGAVTRVNVAADGSQAVGTAGSDVPVFSPDGNLVAFYSSAPNLVPGDSNGATDIFVKNLSTGSVTLVTTASNGTQANSADSSDASFSPDSSNVAFASAATNLVPGDTNGVTDVFLKNLSTGATTRVSTAADGTQANNTSGNPVFAARSNVVAFDSAADNLTPGDTNAQFDVFVKNIDTGAITLASTSSNGTQGNGQSAFSAISADGTKVVFSSDATNLVPNDTNGARDIFVKDLTTGTLTRVNTAADGTQANGSSDNAVFSSDGKLVAFQSGATNLVPGDTNSRTDIFVKDLTTGAITRYPIASDASQGNNTSGDAAFSPDGTKIAFESASSNLVPGDTNGQFDVFVQDIACYVAGTLIRCTRGEVAVEDLVVGDHVVTASSELRPIRWIGRRAYAGRFASLNPDVLPVCFKAGSLTNAVPSTDLWVSPKHAMFVYGALVPAECLVNGVTVVKATRVDSVRYFHIELDSHDLLVANGAPSESFVDDGSRGMFSNAHEHAQRSQNLVQRDAVYCAPRIERGAALEVIRRRLASRADALRMSA